MTWIKYDRLLEDKYLIQKSVLDSKIYCHQNKEPKSKKKMFLSFCFVCYKKTCVMGQNDSYVNQDRETK